jgi:hypothetical protein
VKHAAQLNYQIDMRPLMSSVIGPLRDYGKLQKYGKSLPGGEAMVASGWAAKNKSVSNADLFIDQLPSKLLELERPYVIILELPASDIANPILPAHRDYNKTCGINVYIDANGEVTKFYNWNQEKRQSEYVEEFCANAGEIWAMDTDVPHSVTLVPNKARRMLSFCFTKTKYNEVVECFTRM